MKRLILTTILLLIMTIMVGCSGLAATGDMKSQINQAAIVTKTSVSSETPLLDLQQNASLFAAVSDNSTVNVLSYLFEGKSPLCDAECYDMLRQKRWRAQELAVRASESKLSNANAKLAVQIEYQWALNTQSQLNGTAPVTTVVSVAEINIAARQIPRPRARSETLQAIIESVNNQQAKQWLEEYGESLLSLGAHDANMFIKLLLEGDTETPTKAAISAMSENELMIDCAALLTKDIALTQTNYEKVQTQKAAAKAVLTLGISAVAALLGM